MRPTVRGDVPVDDNGDPVEYADYKDARDDLIERMGDFCSYCEVALHSTVDVEHVQPKSPNPELALEWTNFLLACTNCNSIKGHKNVVLEEHYWTDKDNTLRAFQYEQDLPPQISDDAGIDHIIASRTIELTGLDRIPGHPRFSDRDRRWKKRFEAWSIAMAARANLTAADIPEMRSTIILLAKGIGFWSVWFAVFAHDLDMRRRLITEFPGTAIDCFGDNAELLARPNGQI